jgi:hypothetical protein
VSRAELIEAGGKAWKSASSHSQMHRVRPRRSPKSVHRPLICSIIDPARNHRTYAA